MGVGILGIEIDRRLCFVQRFGKIGVRDLPRLELGIETNFARQTGMGGLAEFIESHIEKDGENGETDSRLLA